MIAKDWVHRVVDELPESELLAALRFLEYLRDVGGDPMVRALMEAPEDDEQITPEEAQGADEAWQEYLRGKARPWEEVRGELAGE